MLDTVAIVIGVACLALLGLWVLWIGRLGWMRSTLAIFMRIAWLTPIFSALFPISTSHELPRSLRLEPLHILVDDSESMKAHDMDSWLESVKASCQQHGCVPRLTYLSEEDHLTKKGFSPISRVLPLWMQRVNHFPWILLSDGGDFQPALSWPADLRGVGFGERAEATASSQKRGLILGFHDEAEVNIWIEQADVAPFSFEGKSMYASVRLRRSGDTALPLRVQVQAEADGSTLASTNAFFESGEEEAATILPVPALQRGSHLLAIRALPTPHERVLWDNVGHRNIEVLANTVGVLHLLGSPSWDGRFLRRFLKSEPKFDLISFFILRDPWDSQTVNERELSLIPFPVARLFNEELPNFRIIILQDFTLLQFLLPEYQRNLVRFVKEGGGLLFLGGARALLNMDIQNSPLREILPFTSSESTPSSNSFSPIMGDLTRASVDQSGPWYDSERSFSIEMARPDAHRRSLANVYDEWEKLSEVLTSFKNGKGLHRTENVDFKDDGSHTPLLLARTDDGKTQPLAVASYPGKGRAIWLFTDSLWRLALTPNAQTPREAYSHLMQGAMTWLLRQELKQPITARNFQIRANAVGSVSWQTDLQGPAVRYFNSNKHWRLSVCGTSVDISDLFVNKITEERWQLRGQIDMSMGGGQRCSLNLEGEHPAFGSLRVTTESIFPHTIPDVQMSSSLKKLQQLSDLTGAELLLSGKSSDSKDQISAFIMANSKNNGISLPGRQKVGKEFFWMMHSLWIWLLLLGLPLEVLIRRWHHLARRNRQSLPIST